jgi:hypothetical protein
MFDIESLDIKLYGVALIVKTFSRARVWVTAASRVPTSGRRKVARCNDRAPAPPRLATELAIF